MATKLIVVLEVELERDVKQLGEEICKRITMHGDVLDANILSIGPDMTPTWAPKPRGRQEKHPVGMVYTRWEDASVQHQLDVPLTDTRGPYAEAGTAGTLGYAQGPRIGYGSSGVGGEPNLTKDNQLGPSWT